MNQLRTNIRNAYFCEDTDVLLNTWNEMMASGRTLEAKYVRELLNEALDEIEETSKW